MPRQSTGRSWVGSRWQRKRGRPFFAFLNYNDAHTPYEVPDDRPRASGSGPRHGTTACSCSWNAADKPKVSLPRCANGHRCL